MKSQIGARFLSRLKQDLADTAVIITDHVKKARGNVRLCLDVELAAEHR